MLRANRTLIVLVLVALLLSACQPITRPTAQEPSPSHGLRFDAPEYAIDGPYGVGVRYFTIPAKTEPDRELTATVWYPAQIPDPTAAKMVYEQKFAPGEVPAISVFGNAALDAPPDAGGSPYPLVVYTHAHWSFGQELPYLAEHLASRGFVVISVDHEDNWSTAFGPMAYQAMIRRPQEVTREIDFAEGLAAPEGSLAGMVDTANVGVTGWSMGGETSLAVAGARWDLNNARTWCAENPAGAELNTWVCSDMLDHEAEMAAFAGLDETPQGLWPSRLDPRIRAAVSLAGPTITFGSDGMKSVDVPVMFMVGSGETAVDPAFEMAGPYESMSAERKAKVVLDHGEHLLFFSSCADTPSTAALGFSSFCTDPVWDMDRAHDLINHFVTAFLLAELKGDAAASAALAPENVSFPGIHYETTGYGSTAAAPVALDAATTAKIDAIVQKAMTDNPIPGFEMCVVKDGEVVYNKGFGLADVAAGRPMTPQSVMIQASISKSLTAMAVLRLVEQGKIDLDARVTDYLPNFTMADPRYQDITVRMLLSHRSGLPEMAGSWDTPLDPSIDPLVQALRWLGDKQLLFAPGTDWAYSDKNYSTVGAIIAAVTGKQYETYMQEEWLTPLGMTHSTYVLGDVDPAQRVAIYDSDAQGKASVTTSQCDERDAPACTLASSCDDMAKWAEFLLNKGEVNGVRLLQPESIDAMWTRLSGTPWYAALGDYYGALLEGYGFGWYVGGKDGHRIVGHTGGINGANTQLQLAPEDGLAVIAMDNWLDLDNPTYPASFAEFDVMYQLLGIKPPAAAAPEPALDEATTAKIETILTGTMQSVDVPGYALCVVKYGSVVYSKGFGTAELGKDLPVTPQSVFAIRSTTKSFTSVALMQLVEQGTVDLDAPVTTYLPYFAMADPGYKDITVRMLASHTSRLVDEVTFASMPPKSEEPAETGAAIEWFVRSLADDTLTAGPPTQWQYAGTNFILLADIIAKVSGEPYDVYVTKHLLEPLGMVHSTLDPAAIPPGLLVGEHVTTAEGVVEATPLSDFSGFEAPEGGIYSTCEDMTRWMQVHANRGELNGVRILQPESYDVLWHPEAATGLDEFFGPWSKQYGLGWSVGEDEGHLLVGHPGGSSGQNIGYQLAPDDQLGVTVLADWGTETVAFPAWTAAADVLDALLGINAQ